MAINYEVIFEKGNYALIQRGEKMQEYAVVRGLNKEAGIWSYTLCYWNFAIYTKLDKVDALYRAIDYFRMVTEENYIPRCRLEELATQFKEESAIEYFDFICEMTNKEKKWFGIETESEEN